MFILAASWSVHSANANASKPMMDLKACVVNQQEMKEQNCSVTPPDGIPENAPFRVTKQSKAYDVQTDLECWLAGCRDRNNRAAFVECSHTLASG